MTVPKPLEGGCHCGAVRFVVTAALPAKLSDCNCSICSRSGYLHLFVSEAQFKLLTPWDALTTYTFNTGVAQHWFCSQCGIKSFYRPRSHPDGYSINARCLDDVDLSRFRVEPFDGQHWEQNVAKLHQDSPDAI